MFSRHLRLIDEELEIVYVDQLRLVDVDGRLCWCGGRGRRRWCWLRRRVRGG